MNLVTLEEVYNREIIIGFLDFGGKQGFYAEGWVDLETVDNTWHLINGKSDGLETIILTVFHHHQKMQVLERQKNLLLMVMVSIKDILIHQYRNSYI